MAGGTLDSWMRSGSSSSAARKRRDIEFMTSEDEQARVLKRLKSQHQASPQRKTPTSSLSKFEPAPLTSPDSKPETLAITEESGDIFNAPDNALIVHACNCDGSWGGGIALAFKKTYPVAFAPYAKHCKASGGDLVGTALLIPPTKNDKHFVGCLFTSRHYGRRKDSPTKILAATGPAMRDLLEQVKEFNAKTDEANRVGEVRICKINSGLFNVPWAKTKAILEGLDVSESDVKMMKVVSPAE